MFGVALSAALWWAYFDMAALLSEERFRHLQGEARLLMARDAYSYLHLPMIAGILLVALGVKKTLGHVDEPLKTVPAVALFGGIALYYAAHVAFRLRSAHTLSRERLVAALVSLALIPVATEVDSLAALGIAAVLAALLIGYESVRHADLRRRAHEASSPWLARRRRSFTACSRASGSTCLGCGAWVGPSPSAHAPGSPGA